MPNVVKGNWVHSHGGDSVCGLGLRQHSPASYTERCRSVSVGPFLSWKNLEIGVRVAQARKEVRKIEYQNVRAPGKSGVHAHGEGERVIALESW